MKERPSRHDAEAPAVAYLLADHLDAALAAAEDLETAARAWPAQHAADTASNTLVLRASERRIVERMRAFEAVLVTRVLRARERARELARTEAEFARLAELFAATTVALVDAVAELGDATANDFDTGDCLVAFLRRRGMIDSEAADLPEGRTIAFDDGFLVAGRIALAPLTEMIIAFIDSLEAVYDLYPENREAARHGRTEAEVTAAPAEGGDAGDEPDSLVQRLAEIRAQVRAQERPS